jgi:hypothetical protein
MRLIDADKYKEDLWAGHEYLDEDTLLTATNILDSQPTIEAEPVRHGRWVDRYGNKYANQLYECSECKEKALYKYEVDVLGNGHFVQALSNACPHCRVKMDGDFE